MQSNRIQKLSPLLINQIAAGEVVTRPASVVKELIENAIDAGATHITIHIEQGGLGLIQVTDNGKGIHPDDMALAVTRHATSKLADVAELTGIDSLGFRGEALASIAAVSHLTLTSSHDNSGIGRQLTLSGNDATQATIQPVVKAQGTSVCVRDLYFNIPARRGHLKSIATEFAHIEQVVQKIAISFAHVRLDLYHQDKQRFSLSNQQDQPSLARLEQALNLSLAQSALPFFLSLQALQTPEQTKAAAINGWLFLPNRTNPVLPKLIYINARLVTDFAISQALSKAARQAGIESLGYALFFDLPSEWINVNIHPAKQQVKIQPLTNLLALLNQAILNQLKQSNVQTATKPAPHPVANHCQQDHASQNSPSLYDFNQNNALDGAQTHLQHSQSSTPQPSQPVRVHWVNEAQQPYLLQALEQTDMSVTWPIMIGEYLIDDDTMTLISWQDNFYLINNLQLAALRELSPTKAAIETWVAQVHKQIAVQELLNLMLMVNRTP